LGLQLTSFGTLYKKNLYCVFYEIIGLLRRIKKGNLFVLFGFMIKRDNFFVLFSIYSSQELQPRFSLFQFYKKLANFPPKN
jgi:hypothetical protein